MNRRVFLKAVVGGALGAGAAVVDRSAGFPVMGGALTKHIQRKYSILEDHANSVALKVINDAPNKTLGAYILGGAFGSLFFK